MRSLVSCLHSGGRTEVHLEDVGRWVILIQVESRFKILRLLPSGVTEGRVSASLTDVRITMVKPHVEDPFFCRIRLFM